MKKFWAAAGFLGLAVAQSWPLPLHLGTRLTGAPGGDTGAYVWNIWVFAHGVFAGNHMPMSTLMVLPLDGATDLGLHNYTLFANLIAFPLQLFVSTVVAFNLVYLLNVALAGWGMFLLAERYTGRFAESWIAGALFACSPFLIARSTGHFSLVAAAPLPIFVYFLDRLLRSHRVHDAFATGACVAWAAMCDPYYAIYCVMLGTVIVGAEFVRVRMGVRPAMARRTVTTVLDGLMLLIVVLVLIVHFGAGGRLRLGPVVVSMRTLYTPVLILSVLAAIRIWMIAGINLSWQRGLSYLPLARNVALATLAFVIVAAPQLYAIGLQALHGDFSSAPVLWRSSAPGVDLVSLFLPNPNHPLIRDAVFSWLDRKPGWYVDNVASLSIVVLVVIAWAMSRGFKPGKLWLAITALFASLALGPFVTVAGFTTYVPTPWAVLRYIPGLGAARMPPRFAIVMTLGLCVLFALALTWLLKRYEHRRRPILAAIGVLLAFELCPVPRTLYSAEIPEIYRIIAGDPRPISVLNLPMGIRDGLSSLGNHSAKYQFYQTAHGKRLIGGYLSRVPERKKEFYKSLPTVSALLTLSAGGQLTAEQWAAARRPAATFLQRRNVGYVVMYQDRTPPALRRFVHEMFDLVHVATADGRELWRPRTLGD